MLLSENIKMAWSSLKNARWRSLLTMLGIIIGVAAVITTVSLGEGLKQQVKKQVGSFGSDLITIRPGQFAEHDQQGNIVGVDLSTLLSGGSLSEADLQIVQRTPEIATTALLSVLPTTIEVNGRQMSATVVVTTDGLPSVLHQNISSGAFWGGDENDKPIAALGKKAATTLFGDNLPIGQSFRLRDQNFLVRGTFEQFAPNPLLPTIDLNKALFIPYGAIKNVLGSAPPIPLILATPRKPSQLAEAVAHLTLNLTSSHGGQTDFTVLKAGENTLPTTAIVGAITKVVIALAVVSLILGGVGIMNVMLVAVTERTREIGIRKAIGATNRQILSQFLAEAAVLSLTGSALGVLLAILGNFGLRILTSLQPAITLWVVILSVVVAVAIGLLFGIMPAFQAARKDPIDALRYE